MRLRLAGSATFTTSVQTSDTSTVAAAAPSSAKQPSSVPGRRSTTCGQCPGCLRKEDCNECRFCLDKPRNGGANSLRKGCREKMCICKGAGTFIAECEQLMTLLPLRASPPTAAVGGENARATSSGSARATVIATATAPELRVLERARK